MPNTLIPKQPKSSLKRMAIVSLGCGIFSIVLISITPLLLWVILTTWISSSRSAQLLFYFLISVFGGAFLFAIIGFIMGIGINVRAPRGSTERKFAIGGIVTSLIVLIFIGYILYWLIYLKWFVKE